MSLRKRSSATPRQRSAGAMHYRFEIRLLAGILVGEPPEVTILRIAWEDKRQHLSDWMAAYHRRYRVLPRGCHDLGRTARHGLEIGVVDFDAARDRLARRLANDEDPTWRRVLRDSLVARLLRLCPGIGIAVSRLPADGRLL